MKIRRKASDQCPTLRTIRRNRTARLQQKQATTPLLVCNEGKANKERGWPHVDGAQRLEGKVACGVGPAAEGTYLFFSAVPDPCLPCRSAGVVIKTGDNLCPRADIQYQ